MAKARMSALPVLQYCGQAQILGESSGAGRMAALGTAFHAVCSSHPDKDALLARLSDRERAEVDELIKPAPFTWEGIELGYESACRERQIALDVNGLPCEYGSDEAFVQGTADLQFFVDLKGKRTVIIVDIKKTSFAAPDGPLSLQLLGYAVAFARHFNADGYVTGIWDATSGEYSWSDWFDIWGEAASQHWERIVAAVKNHGGEYSLGTHCQGCYSRGKCPQYLLPLDMAETSLAALTTEDGLDDAKAVEALMLAERTIKTAEAVKERVKMYALENGKIVDEARGKVYRPIRIKGRATLDRKRFEAENPELAMRYTAYGSEYNQFRWVNK